MRRLRASPESDIDLVRALCQHTRNILRRSSLSAAIQRRRLSRYRMKRYAKLHLALITALLTMSNPSLAESCLGKEAVPAAKKFLTSHYGFYAEAPSANRALMSPRLVKALDMERKCAKEEVCALDGDPWLNAQDGNMGKKVDYVMARETATDAVVDIRYDFILDPKGRPEKRDAKLVLQRGASGQCWLVGDLISPGGESLVAYLEKWHAKYGAAAKTGK